VWVTHGREDALVYWCKKQGLNAEPLALPGLDDDGGEGGE
jgi:putative mRNA 3-end processing factor